VSPDQIDLSALPETYGLIAQRGHEEMENFPWESFDSQVMSEYLQSCEVCVVVMSSRSEKTPAAAAGCTERNTFAAVMRICALLNKAKLSCDFMLLCDGEVRESAQRALLLTTRPEGAG
jgi:hypothetical protein